MKTQIPLIEFLARQMHCDYLSDLRFLRPVRRQELAGILRRLPAQKEDTRQWQALYTYLTGSPPETTTAEEIRNALLVWLTV